MQKRPTEDGFSTRPSTVSVAELRNRMLMSRINPLLLTPPQNDNWETDIVYDWSKIDLGAPFVLGGWSAETWPSFLRRGLGLVILSLPARYAFELNRPWIERHLPYELLESTDFRIVLVLVIAAVYIVGMGQREAADARRRPGP